LVNIDTIHAVPPGENNWELLLFVVGGVLCHFWWH